MLFIIYIHALSIHLHFREQIIQLLMLWLKNTVVRQCIWQWDVSNQPLLSSNDDLTFCAMYDLCTRFYFICAARVQLNAADS